MGWDGMAGYLYFGLSVVLFYVGWVLGGDWTAGLMRQNGVKISA